MHKGGEGVWLLAFFFFPTKLHFALASSCCSMQPYESKWHMLHGYACWFITKRLALVLHLSSMYMYFQANVRILTEVIQERRVAVC